MANGFHITLPPQEASYYYSKTKSVSRRTPLTPSTITPPSVNAFTSATRRDSCGSEPSQARSLLAKVVSHPASPRRTPMASPMTTPTQEDPRLGMPTPRSEPWKTKSRQDAVKHYWSHQRQQDGYISFPDYEKYWSTYGGDVQRERSRDRSSAKG